MYSNEEYLLEILQENGLITSEDIVKAKTLKQGKESVIDTLIRTRSLTHQDIARVSAVNANMEYVDLNEVRSTPEAIEAIPEATAKRYKVIPISLESGRLKVAVSDPLDFETLDSLPHILHHDLDFVCSPLEQIHSALVQYYGDADEAAKSLARKLGADGSFAGMDGGGDKNEGDKLEADDAPIIKMVSQFLVEAFKVRASDIHLEPLERKLRVRYRIDGVLHEIDNYPKKLLSAIISRIKIMTGTMSIAEKRIPQDGRIQVNMGDKKQMDLRVSTIPTNHGESVVMRILDKSSLLLGLPQLGFFSDDQEVFEKLITLPDGILLVTGPTGSGKTTTLYACLNHINRPDRKIITVEDPVEYELAGINQVMVKEDIGMTFQAALRSILRQAPNIVMIGEIRDLETATIAINASLTGHLVFSTLHTNDAPSAIARLCDIGVKPFLLASAIRAIIAQRLIRSLCSQCKQPVELTDQEMRVLRIDQSRLKESKAMGEVGCEKCRHTGYKGRLGIFELFKIDDEVRHMINENLSTPALRRRARELGMRTLREDGVRKVLAGLTSASEVIHATMSDYD